MAGQQRPRSDALVFFGATGDLAYKKIFPALQSMVRRGRREVRVIGVAKGGWSRDARAPRAGASIVEPAHLDEDAFAKLTPLTRSVDGDYADASTFPRL